MEKSSSFSSAASVSLKRRVRFAKDCQVTLIENARKSYSKQELKDTYYTKQDMRRWRKMAEALAEDLSFYSCEELWDRFGVRSKTQQHLRRQIRWACRQAIQSFNEENQEDDLPELLADSEHSEDDDASASSRSDSFPLEEYFKICDACAVVAKARAMRIQEQVYRSNGLAREF